MAETKIDKLGTRSPSRYLVHQWILGQRLGLGLALGLALGLGLGDHVAGASYAPLSMLL